MRRSDSVRAAVGWKARRISAAARIRAASAQRDGTTITNSAGNFDDGARAEGALITVGGNDDPFSPFLPTVAADHERYDIAPYVNAGDTMRRRQASGVRIRFA